MENNATNGCGVCTVWTLTSGRWMEGGMEVLRLSLMIGLLCPLLI